MCIDHLQNSEPSDADSEEAAYRFQYWEEIHIMQSMSVGITQISIYISKRYHSCHSVFVGRYYRIKKVVTPFDRWSELATNGKIYASLY